MRALAIGNLICINAFVVYTYDLLSCATELSHWGLWLTTLWILISLKCSTDPQIGKKSGWLVAHHTLFEIVAPMNLLIFVVYWTMLREQVLSTIANTPMRARHSGLMHTMPLLWTIVNFMVTDIVMKASHCVILLPIAVGYGFFNY